MKKNLVALLLVLVVVSFGLFAVVDPAEFTVTTTVNGVAYMGVTNEEYDAPNANDYYTLFTNLEIEEAGPQDFTAYITSFSNNPGGYTISMAATAMVNGIVSSDPIHYTISANSASFDTESDTAAVVVLTTGTLGTMTGSSYLLTLDVDEESFAAAVTGDYEGTVTFTYTAN